MMQPPGCGTVNVNHTEFRGPSPAGSPGSSPAPTVDAVYMTPANTVVASP